MALVGLMSGAAAGAAPTAEALVSAAVPEWAATAAPAPLPAAPPPAVAQPAVAQPAVAQLAVDVPAAPAPALVPGTPCTSAARACIDLSANRTWLIRNGAVEYGPVPITHGRKGWRTPPGTFTVTFKNKNHRSTIFDNAPMPYAVFFNGGIAFHQGSLREPSHGCVHLSKGAAQRYFAALSRGDVVQVVR
ncbi:L,D-transpeptidase [Actinomycetes bacterium KLBMP 9759]